MKLQNKTRPFELGEAEKNVLIDMLQEQILLLKEKNKRLEKRLGALEGRVNKNSSNSSKPPSSDMNKPKKTTSSKNKSGKKPGGQPGHKGKTLKNSRAPDQIVRLSVTNCEECGNNLKNKKISMKSRQEFEIPEPKIFITEYQSESRDCSCGYTTTACFPKHITHASQYGIRAKSLMVYMNQHQFIPYDRASQFFETVYGQKISPATIVNAVNTLGNRLCKLDSQIKKLLSKSDTAHCDETSMKISGTKHWLHTVGTKKLAHYAMHEKRGSKATQDIGILPEFKGTIIHDHWKSYFQYKNSKHALCNAHHLLELRFINEQHKMKWAKKMSLLLIKIKEHKDLFVKKSKDKFTKWLLKKHNSEYNAILVKAHREQARRGTLDSRNLIKRLSNFKQETLLFMNDFTIPFTNNLSEQDLRMSKVKQKISGCFRNTISADSFCKIRSMLISGRKNSKNIFKLIQRAFSQNITTKAVLAT